MNNNNNNDDSSSNSDREVLERLSNVSTSVQWAVLGSVVSKAKIGENRGVVVDGSGTKGSSHNGDNIIQSVARILRSQSKQTLKKDYGIWVHFFDDEKQDVCRYQPLILTNPAFRRKSQQLQRENNLDSKQVISSSCTCSAATKTSASSSSSSNSNRQGDGSQFLSSTAYNAGRHGIDMSSHKPNCLLWTPPSAGHLFSWRRGF